MPVKTPVKKTMLDKFPKNVRRPVRKTPRSETLRKLEEKTEKIKAETLAAKREAQQIHKETEKLIKETWQAIKENQRNIGGLNNTLGSIVERLLIPSLPEKFKELGYSFNRISSYSWSQGVFAQVDGMLENGTQAVVVEVKSKLRIADIDDHLKRMEKIRKFYDEYGDKRQFMGALASTITDDSNRSYALKKGLFVIEPSGEEVKVTKPAEPHIW